MMPADEIPQYIVKCQISLSLHNYIVFSLYPALSIKLAYAIIQGTRWEGLSGEGPKNSIRLNRQGSFALHSSKCVLSTRKARNVKAKLCNRLASTASLMKVKKLIKTSYIDIAR